MWCTCWVSRRVLIEAFVLFLTPPLGTGVVYSFGSEVVYWLGLTLCTNEKMLFLLHPLLALKLCTGWAGRCVLMGTIF